MALTDMGDAPDPKRYSKNSGMTTEQVEARERDMIELRIAGGSLSQIAELFDVDESRVSRIVNRGLMRMRRDRMELRELLLARADKIVRAYWEDAVGVGSRKRDASAAKVVVLAMREQARLGQLDTIDDTVPNETAEQRASRVAEQFESYLKGRDDAAAEQPVDSGQSS